MGKSDKIESFIWYEKYRHKKLSKMILPDETLDLLNNFIDKGEVPHLMLKGPPGSGKTTIAMILINKLAAGRLVLNASSDDRGIATVKTKVKQFAAAKTADKSKLNIVFFDEADGLTTDAQFALKNTIETFHKNCRFIFTCNEIDKIIPPIQSRCIHLNFETPPFEIVVKNCRRILKTEGIDSKRKDIKTIVSRYYPDIRSVINNLQACSVTGKFNTKHVLDRFDPMLIIDYINKGKIFAARNLWSDTFDFTRLYKALANIISTNEKKCAIDLKHDQRSDALLILAEYLYKDHTIADRELNFTACVIEIMNLTGASIDFKSTS